MDKWPIFGPKPWTNPYEKSEFFDLLNMFFFKVRKAFFAQYYYKTHFFWIILLKNKKNRKKVDFGPKPWTNLFGKISMFRFFQLVVFKA